MDNGDDRNETENEPYFLSDALENNVVLKNETIRLWKSDDWGAPRTDNPTELSGAIFASLVHPLVDTLFNLLRQGKCKLTDLECFNHVSLEHLDTMLETNEPWTKIIREGLEKIEELNYAIADAEGPPPEDRYLENALLDPLKGYFEALRDYEKHRYDDVGN